MTTSYARIETKEAKRLAGQTVEVVKRIRAQFLNNMVLRELYRHNWWCFLPWVKPWNVEQAKFVLTKHGVYWCIMHFSVMNRAEAILNLVKAAGSDPFLYITAEDYQQIQFGVDYDRLK